MDEAGTAPDSVFVAPVVECFHVPMTLNGDHSLLKEMEAVRHSGMGASRHGDRVSPQ